MNMQEFARQTASNGCAVTSHDVKHVFLVTGAEANTGWLNGRVALHAKGFIKTGPDLTAEDLAAAQWPLERSPYLLPNACDEDGVKGARATAEGRVPLMPPADAGCGGVIICAPQMFA